MRFSTSFDDQSSLPAGDAILIGLDPHLLVIRDGFALPDAAAAAGQLDMFSLPSVRAVTRPSKAANIWPEQGGDCMTPAGTPAQAPPTNWLAAFPIQPATEAVEALRQGWMELALRPRPDFNPKTKEGALTKRLKVYVENDVARRRGLLGMWAAEDIIGDIDPGTGAMIRLHRLVARSAEVL